MNFIVVKVTTQSVGFIDRIRTATRMIPFIHKNNMEEANYFIPANVIMVHCGRNLGITVITPGLASSK